MGNIGVGAIILIVGIILLFVWFVQLSVKTAIKHTIGNEIRTMNQVLNEVNVKLDDLRNK